MLEVIRVGGNKHKPRSRGEGQQRKSKHGDEKVVHGWKARSSQKISKNYRTSTVLFIEYSHDGGLQKTMRGVVEKLAPMLGFTVRISERGGTPLSSLLSNKNLWGGQPCGRGWGECYPCHQKTELKEPCTMRNIVYESECEKCNVLGNHKERDKSTLSDARIPASIYVGESARSLAERSKEHWGDLKKGKAESHMNTHWQDAHGGEDHPPQFNFRVVKRCKTALSRQVAEAVRIQLRGSVLNIKGVYNRSKLTRLVVDEEWDKKVWADSWSERAENQEVSAEDGVLRVQNKNKKKYQDHDKPPAKRRKGYSQKELNSEVEKIQPLGNNSNVWGDKQDSISEGKVTGAVENGQESKNSHERRPQLASNVI